MPIEKRNFMNRVLMLAVIALLVMMPFASFARTAISDNDLDAVTAATGVSVAFTNDKVSSVALTVTSWGDSDGFSGYSGTGYMGVNGVTIGGNIALISGTMNVDVGTSGASTRMNVVLPAITLGTMNVDASLVLDSVKTLNNNSNLLGSLDMKGFSTQIGGTVTVFAHN